MVVLASSSMEQLFYLMAHELVEDFIANGF